MKLHQLSPLPPSRLRGSSPTPFQGPSDGDGLAPGRSDSPSWGRLGLMALGALGTLAGSAGLAQAQEVQVQDRLGATTAWMDQLGQQQSTRYSMYIGLMGREVDIPREQAARMLAQDASVFVHTSEFTRLGPDTRMPLDLKTELRGWRDLQNFVHSQSGQLSQSEVEHWSKVLKSYQGVQGDSYFEIRDVAVRGDQMRPTHQHLSSYEAAARLLRGQPVALTSTPLSDVLRGTHESLAPQPLQQEVQIVTGLDQLLELPSQFDAAREVWHPLIPGTGQLDELCQQVGPEYGCEQGILRR